MRILLNFSKIFIIKYALKIPKNDIFSLQEMVGFLYNHVEKIEEEKSLLQKNHHSILQEKIKTDA